MMELEQYQRWLNYPQLDHELAQELSGIRDNQEEIKERFYQDLTFGTAGIRGIMGAGPNRMNIYVIRRATQGFADFLKEKYDAPSVAIGYDSRIKSDVFAKETACVLAANGITSYLYHELIPVPCLSFAVRELDCCAGVMVTASHNPAPYNGYKAYGNDGSQISLEDATAIFEHIRHIDLFDGVQRMELEEGMRNGLIQTIPDRMLESFFNAIQRQALHPECSKQTDLKVVYTPLNGAGNKPVREILKRIGIQNVMIVSQQEHPDGNFPTCPYPNPEMPETLQLGLDLCQTSGADLLLATDPDCDRIGVAVPDATGKLVVFSGNEIGMMLMEYICSQRTEQGTMPSHPVVISTIVSTTITDKIAAHYGVELRRVLTGFKFIGEQILQLEADGNADRCIFAFEESYGYLIGTHARDKDGVVAAMMICDMAAYLRTNGMSLLDFLEQIYQTYGVYHHTQQSFVCHGKSGMERMQQTMQHLQQRPPTSIAALPVLRIDNYLTGQSWCAKTDEVSPLHLPKSSVLTFHLPEDASVSIRPSGTEPKIKVYYTTVKSSKAAAYQQDEALRQDVQRILGLS